MSSANAHKTVAIIGGGITGLSAAFKLHELAQTSRTPIQCTIFEAGKKAGGIIESHTADDCLLELGADSFITNKPWGINLIRRLGLEDQIESTNSQWRRTLVARDKRLYPLPQGFRLVAPTDISSFLASRLLSITGKARVLMDLNIPKRESTGEETVADFTRRRLGGEALRRIVQPMIGGIYVGDVERLSIQATMPWLCKLESEYGSLIKGLRAGNDTDVGSGVRYGMFVSLKGGLQKLVDTIIAKLPNQSLVPNSSVQQIKKGDKYELVMKDGEPSVFDAVIMATPAHETARFIEPVDFQLSQELAQIEYVSSAILNLVYKRSQIPNPLEGFGFVVPHSEKRSIIACTFSSIKFPGRVPSDTETFRVFMGGALAPHMTQCSDATLTHLACAELYTFLGIDTKPVLVHISRYDNAMPQYVIGHQDRVNRIMKQLEAFPGLTVAGNGYHGVGIPDCIHSGELAAETIHAHLAHQAFVPTV